MTYLEFNPTWTVPPGMVRREVLPELRRGLEVLTQRELTVIDAEARPLDPRSIDWEAAAEIGTSDFPYAFRQGPGPENPMGRVKFMYPNQHYVYMHDTPERELFGASLRAFSAGCVRIERPLELARHVLAGDGWDTAAIEQVLAEGRPIVVDLPRPLPVLMTYVTAVSENGSLHFLPDIYGRDAAVVAALHEPYQPPAPRVSAAARRD